MVEFYNHEEMCSEQGHMYMGNAQCVNCGKEYDCAEDGHAFAQEDAVCIHCRKTRKQIVKEQGFINS